MVKAGCRQADAGRRREFIAVLASAVVAWPLAARAQAMIPRTGMTDAQNPMPMKERYLKRFPQPARVGDLIGMPVLDLNSKTLGYVQQVVQTPAGEIEFIVGYSRWWGWFERPIAVPLEVLGIEGGHLVPIDSLQRQNARTNLRQFGAFHKEPGNLCLMATAWWGWEDSNFQPNDYSWPLRSLNFRATALE